MTEKEVIFMQSAISASNGKDGNFDFACPHCAGYSIGTMKCYFNLIMASCSKCRIFIKQKIMEKGA